MEVAARRGDSGSESRRSTRRTTLLAQLARFAVVAGLIAVLNPALFLLARTWFGPFTANVVATAAGTSLGGELNRRFTFRGSTAHGWRLQAQNGLAVLYYVFSGSAALFVLGLFAGGATPVEQSVAVGTAGTVAALGRFAMLRYWVFTRTTRTGDDAPRPPRGSDGGGARRGSPGPAGAARRNPA